MKVCRFEEIESEIVSHLRERRLIPVIGSGFSVGSQSLSGTVPSGKEMKSDMIESITKYFNRANESSLGLTEKTFSQIATYYHKTVPKDIQRSYIKDKFTCIDLNLSRKQFLDINWLYIYTLNIDDSIERNSEYKHVLVSNRNIDFSILSDEKCLLKLHGDAKHILSYSDDDSQIFDYKQYAKSITTNISLLKKRWNGALRSPFGELRPTIAAILAHRNQVGIP